MLAWGGSCDCLVGVLDSEDHRCIFPDSDPIFDDCEEVSTNV